MKKLKEILLVLTMISGLFSSCKKYDQCCKATAYDNIDKFTRVYEDCDSDMSKKEYEEFKYNNNAQKAYDSFKAYPDKYEDKTYECN